jgi:multisubunit Na+/H+ antiporter MnhG subunit
MDKTQSTILGVIVLAGMVLLICRMNAESWGEAFEGLLMIVFFIVIIAVLAMIINSAACNPGRSQKNKSGKKVSKFLSGQPAASP